METVTVDVNDDDALRAWYDTYLAAELHEQEYATPWMYPELLARVRAAPVDKTQVLLSGLERGEVVAAGLVELPLMDNLDRGWLLAYTRPDVRRRGHGTAMLAALEDLLRARGRHLAGADTDYAYALGPEGVGAPGVEFLRARGYTFALGDVKRALDLPVDQAVLDSLAAEAAPHHRDYPLRQFVDRCPDDLVESYGRLIGTLVTEAPSGEMELETEVYDEQRIRHEEAVAAEGGRRNYVTVALAPDGEVVAYSHLVVPSHHPGRVYQWGTLVHPDHRGRRLGIAVKAANHTLLQQHEHEVDVCLTWNAEVNAPMIGINERMGYRKVGRSAEFEKKLD